MIIDVTVAIESGYDPPITHTSDHYGHGNTPYYDPLAADMVYNEQCKLKVNCVGSVLEAIE